MLHFPWAESLDCPLDIFCVVCFCIKAMAPHSSTLAWEIPWMEGPGGLQSMGSLRVGHDSETSLSLSCIGEGHGNPLQCSCLENPRDRGAWWVAVYAVTRSRTRLKRLSSSSSSIGKEPACRYRRLGFHPWVEKIPWRRKWQPTPVCLPGKSKDGEAWRATAHGRDLVTTQ